MTADTSLSASEREIMTAVRRHGAVTRSDLADLTSLSQQSVHRLVEQLLQKGLLTLGEAVIKGRGKPSPIIEINVQRHVSLGLSIGTEHLRFSALDLAGEVLVEEELNVVAATPDEAMDLFERFLGRWPCRGALSDQVLGVGVAIQGYRTGPIDEFYPPDALSGWRGTPLLDRFRQRLNLPVFVENNATASAVAEHALGGGRQRDSLVYLAFNYGFGAGLVSAQSALLGAHGNAGEISSIFTPEEQKHRPALSELMKRLRSGGVQIDSLQQLRTGFDPDWPALAGWLDEIRPTLHLALRALKSIADPAAIYFGGDAPLALRQMLIKASDGAFGSQTSPNPKLLPSGIEGDAAHLGAAFFPLNELVY